VDAERIRQSIVVPTDQRVRAGENFAAALQKLGLTPQEATDATSAAQQAFNLRQLRAGNTLTVGRSVEGQLREIDYRIDVDRMLKILPQEQGFSAKVADIPSRTEIVAVRGTLDDSLFNAVEETGESAELAMRMAQIFGYDLDFYTDPRRGDTFCILLEKKRYVNGQIAGYGKIFAAEYNNAGKKYQALLYHDPAGQPGYYAEDGKSLQKAFLRSPLKFGAPVTSHFSNARFQRTWAQTMARRWELRCRPLARAV
jgi:murein DD-endopeptidase MepM/ murein hydrolase activator NlpD